MLMHTGVLTAWNHYTKKMCLSFTLVTSIDPEDTLKKELVDRFTKDEEQ
jgi:hypothetical protein